jgi:hypothetical protein
VVVDRSTYHQTNKRVRAFMAQRLRAQSETNRRWRLSGESGQQSGAVEQFKFNRPSEERRLMCICGSDGPVKLGWWRRTTRIICIQATHQRSGVCRLPVRSVRACPRPLTVIHLSAPSVAQHVTCAPTPHPSLPLAPLHNVNNVTRTDIVETPPLVDGWSVWRSSERRVVVVMDRSYQYSRILP